MYYEQRIKELEDKVSKQKDRYWALEQEMLDIRRINKVLDIENRIAVSMIINSGKSGNKEEWKQHDRQVNSIIDALQYIIEWNNNEIISSNNESEAVCDDDRVLQRTHNNSDSISRIKNEIRDVITKNINKENDSDASNSQLSSDYKVMGGKYNDLVILNYKNT